MTETVFLDSRSELVPRLKDLIRPILEKRKLDASIAVIVEDRSFSKYIEKELLHEIGSLFGIKIGLPSNILSGSLSSSSPHRSIRLHCMKAALIMVKPEILDSSNALSISSSFLIKYDSFKKWEIKPNDDAEKTIFKRYAEELERVGFKDRIDALMEMDVVDFKDIIVITENGLTSFEQMLLGKIGFIERKDIDLGKGPKLADDLAEGKLIATSSSPSNIHITRFSWFSDEVLAVVKMVRRSVKEGIDPTKIVISAPADRLEEFHRVLHGSGTIHDYKYSVPLNGPTTTRTVSLLAKIMNDPLEPRNLLHFSRDPLISNKKKEGLDIIPNYLESLIKRWNIRYSWEWKKVLDSERPYLRSNGRTGEIKSLNILEKVINTGTFGTGRSKDMDTLSGHCIRLYKFMNGVELVKKIADLQEDLIKRNSQSYIVIERNMLEIIKQGNEIELSKNDFSELFLELISNEKITERSLTTSGVRLISHDDLVPLNVDRVFLAGAGEMEFPRTKSRIPLTRKGDIKVQLDAENEVGERKAFRTLVELMDGVSLFISHDLETSMEPSPLISRFLSTFDEVKEWEPPAEYILMKEVESDFQRTKDEIEGSSKGELIKKGGALRSREIETGSEYNFILKNEYLQVLRDIIDDDYTWSPSRFETLVKCPFKFLCENLLKIKEEDEDLFEIDALRRGSMLHEILEGHCRDIITGKLVEDRNALIDDMGKRVDEQLNMITLSTISADNIRRQMLGRKGGSGMLTAFVDWELSDDGGRPLLLECSFGIDRDNDTLSVKEELVIPVPPGECVLDDGTAVDEIRFRGVIDRIEELHGRWHVMDYKSGNIYKLKGKDKMEYYPLQLGLYYLAAKELFKEHLEGLEPGGAYYQTFKVGSKKRIRGLPSFDGKINKILLGEKIIDFVDKMGSGFSFNKTVKDIYYSPREKKPTENMASNLLKGKSPDTDHIKDVSDIIQDYIRVEKFRDEYEMVMEPVLEETRKTIFENLRFLLNGRLSPTPDDRGVCGFCTFGNICNSSTGGGGA